MSWNWKREKYSVDARTTTSSWPNPPGAEMVSSHGTSNPARATRGYSRLSVKSCSVVVTVRFMLPSRPVRLRISTDNSAPRASRRNQTLLRLGASRTLPRVDFAICEVYHRRCRFACGAGAHRVRLPTGLVPKTDLVPKTGLVPKTDLVPKTGLVPKTDLIPERPGG